MILLGSTGSIGVNTLNIARRFNLNVEVLVAGKNIDLLNEQIKEFKPKKVVIEQARDIPLVCHNNVSFGEEAILEAIEQSKTSTFKLNFRAIFSVFTPIEPVLPRSIKSQS